MPETTVEIELEEGAWPPEYQTAGSAGADLRAHLAGPLVLAPGCTALVPTGLRLVLPEGYEAQVRSRSGLAARHGVACLNAPGTIDSDYRGEVKVILHNHGPEPYAIEPGDRIAQLVVAPVCRASFVVSDGTLGRLAAADGDTGERAVPGGRERGSGGFGSTGR